MYDLLLNSLSAALNGKQYKPTDGSKIAERLNESKLQSVYPLVFHSIMQGNPSDSEYTKVYYQIIAGNIRNQADHKLLHKMMNNAGIKYVILKGYASAQYYPSPDLRTMGDVDFLIDPSSCEIVDHLLQSNGFIRHEENSEHGYHWGYTRQSSSVELHWAAPGIPRVGEYGDRIRDCLSDIIEKAQYQGGCMIPSRFHHGIVLLLHSAGHMTAGGMGLRHLCDWAVFVNSFDASEFKGTFEETLKNIGLWEFARVLTAVSVKYLGIKKASWCDGVEMWIIDGIMQDICDSGNFGCKDRQRLNQSKLLRNADDRTVGGGCFHNVFVFLNNRARKAMPITARIPVLLPIGWLYVGGRHIYRIITRKKERIDIHETILGARKRQELYERLKLFSK